MNRICVDFSLLEGKVKPMHAVNNGPIVAGAEQVRSNFDTFKAAKIPFVRNHDASFCMNYGGEHTVDVHAIFPDFDADPNDPASYDFFYTDQYTRQILDAGSEVYYRLGSKIEHGKKKYGTVMPKDFHKWAVICEHIIRHYNEGWADGHHWNIRHWEIWNEPDGVALDGNQPNWSGTAQEFYELYRVASRHLKGCFPNLMIGGPAVCSVNEDWLNAFLAYQKQDGQPSPIDFLGWHGYCNAPEGFAQDARKVRRILDAAGYTHTESYLNEWNYLDNWTDLYVASIEAVIGMRGAAMNAACMCMGQREPIDMMMYYDARPCCLNGMFDFYTYRPLKGYYPFLMFSQLYQLGQAVHTETSHTDLYAAAATDGNRHAALIAYYSVDRNAAPQYVKLNIAGTADKKMHYYLLDEHHTMQEMALPENREVRMLASSVILVTDYNIYDEA